MKDLASLKNTGKAIKRRHSISKCESVILKPSTEHVEKNVSNKNVVSPTIAVGASVRAVQPTLNLSLAEAGHIRSVLVRAEIEVGEKLKNKGC